MIFKCCYSYFPILKTFNETGNHLILLTKERIKRKVRCWMIRGLFIFLGKCGGLPLFAIGNNVLLLVCIVKYFYVI